MVENDEFMNRIFGFLVIEKGFVADKFLILSFWAFFLCDQRKTT